MFTSIENFKIVWQQETASTIACFDKLTDESLFKELVHDYRTIGRLANHITDCAISIPHEASLPVVYKKENYASQQALLTAYKIATEKVREAIATWTDATLQEDVTMYGETWKKGFALWVTVVHQVHHRGQLTVLMRMAGLPVPGVYGPCKEEWEAMAFLPPAD